DGRGPSRARDPRPLLVGTARTQLGWGRFAERRDGIDYSERFSAPGVRRDADRVAGRAARLAAHAA
ncbi:MAG: hypothetical protein ACRDWD_08750, partial [Acidimicrobiia bacterium]